MTHQLLQAIVLGLIEGITEFLPVSSTGHMILAERLFGWQQMTNQVFEIVIQLGAILAICLLYARRLIAVVVRLPHDAAARHMVASLFIALLPSIVVGLLLHDFVKHTLFAPVVVCLALIIGGAAIIMIEKYFNAPDRYNNIEALPQGLALKIGLAQLLALVPGVSRSGATIMGGIIMGVSRKTAAEFSFFLAIPTMVAASGLELVKNAGALTANDMTVIAVGFVTAFVSALVVVKWLMRYITRHDFTAFGWYRIIAGVSALALLYFR